MLGSDAALVVGGLVLVGLAVLTVTAAAWTAWRAVRRRWRALHRQAAVRGALALWSLARTALASTARGSHLGWPRGHSSAMARRRLWGAVGAAERAVHDADDAGGSVGDLPSLVRRLHDVAAELDRVLRMGDGLGAGSPALVNARRHAADVVAAATRIRLAAVAAAGDAARARVAALSEDADREVRSLAAGLARARSALPTHQSA